MQPTKKVPPSTSGPPSWTDSRSGGGCSQSMSTRDSVLSNDFFAPSATASTPNTQLSESGAGLEADANWQTGLGYDGARSAQTFSKATGRGKNSEPASLRGNGNAILMGTARSGHRVNHLVIRTRREHIAGGCTALAYFWCAFTLTTISCTGRYYVDPNLDVPDHATPLKPKSLNPTYSRPRPNSFSDEAPALSRTNGGRDSRDLALSSQKGKLGSRATPWKPGVTANETACHALIDSKSGDIDIKLHVGGWGKKHAKQALIDGKLGVKLITLSGGRRVHLDVITGKGTSCQLTEVPTRLRRHRAY